MYYDYHTYTDVSEDSITPADEMIEAAIKKGIVKKFKYYCMRR